MKIAIVAAVAIILALAALMFAQHSASLAEQKMCSEHAKTIAAQRPNSEVVNHYNKPMNTCFVQIHAKFHDSDNQNKRSFFELEDAFEGSVYGQCLINADDKTVVQHVCWANGQKAGEKKTFTSSDEWLRFVGQKYMTP